MELTREHLEMMFGVYGNKSLSKWPFELQPATIEQLLAHDKALRTRIAACEADKAKAEARVQTLEQALQEIVQAGVRFDARGSHSEWVVLRSKLALEDAQHALEGG